MDWDAIQTALAAWLVRASGLSAAQVFHADEPIQLVTHPHIRYRFSAPRQVGMDEIRWTYDAGAALEEEMTATVQGVREFTFEIDVRTRDQRPAGSARALTSKIRTSIQLPSNQVAFNAANLGVIGAEDTQDLDLPFQNRQESRAVLEVAFSTGDCLTDTPQGYIATTQVDVELDGASVFDKTFPE